MHAISSYRGNRYRPHARPPQTQRQDRLQYTAPLASAQCKYMQRKVYTRMYIYLQNFYFYSPIHTRQLPDREVLDSREPQSCAAHPVPITRPATPHASSPQCHPLAHAAPPRPRHGSNSLIWILRCRLVLILSPSFFSPAFSATPSVCVRHIIRRRLQSTDKRMRISRNPKTSAGYPPA